jgi:hypothetical protein
VHEAEIMRLPRAWPLLALATLAAAVPDDGFGPYPTLACYKDASERLLLTNTQALQLCVGAASPAPSSCFSAATNQAGLTDLDGVRLCEGATSDAPAYCVARLQQTTGYDTATIVEYCAASTYALVPPPQPGVPACLQAAKQGTVLADSDALRLCQGSETADPVECYRYGRSHTVLPDNDLITLCATVVPYTMPYNIGTPGAPYP